MWITGLYSLTIIAGSIYCQTDVRLPPTITQNPIRNFNYRSEDSVRLRCRAFGIPSVDYEWTKNDGFLNLNQNNIKRIQDGFGTIEINPITALDEGYYQCIAKNHYGTAMSNTSFLQMAVYTPSQQSGITTMTVTEGEPFRIQNQPVKSVPSATYEWEPAVMDRNQYPLMPTKRMQVGDNGDLHFAYAVAADDLGGRIYKATAFNEYLDLRSGGSFTNVTVNRATGGIKKFAPTLGFSSDAMTIAVEDKTVSLRCFFYGNPEPSITWTGPRNTLPVGRFRYSEEKSKLQIFDVKPSDQGDYTCTGTNDQGSNRHTLQIKVEAKPKFLSFDDRPHDTNITEGYWISFNCMAYAIPEATVTWYRNGKRIDVNAPPKRYSFSNDKKTLTIKDLCRNCDDRPESAQSDLGIIQCNASNVHGYDFGAGYVNVLTKTNVVVIADNLDVEVEMNEEKRVVFDCKATSDPITPVTPKWWLLQDNSKGALLVYDDPPVVTLKDGQLVIHVVSGNNSEEWVKHRGIYNCTASNNYSTDYQLTAITIKNYMSPEIPENPFVKNAAAITATCICFVLILAIIITVVFICCRRRRENTYHEMHVTPLYETLPGEGYESIRYDVLSTNQGPLRVGHRKQTTENVRRNNAVESMYETITDNTDDLAYDDRITTAEGGKKNILPSSTVQHDENKEVKNDYIGLTDRENAYLPVYTDLQQGDGIGIQDNSLSTTVQHYENTQVKNDYTSFTDRENAN